jgi:hypothetical protein
MFDFLGFKEGDAVLSEWAEGDQSSKACPRE